MVLEIEIFSLQRAFKTRHTILFFTIEELNGEILKYLEFLSFNADIQHICYLKKIV